MKVRQSCEARVSVNSLESGIPVGFRRRGDTEVDLGGAENVPWNSDGAKQTAKLLLVIWFIIAWLATLCRNSNRYCNTSRCSSGKSKIADCTASKWTSDGRSNEEKKKETGDLDSVSKWIVMQFESMLLESIMKIWSPSGIIHLTYVER